MWDIKKASKLIESFILGYPVPNILLGRDPETEIMEVIDGQQRILSICDFFKGKFRNEKIFKLIGDIESRFEGKTFEDLDEPIQKKLKNAVLKAVVLVYPKDDHNIKFTAFHRINTGSVILNQQEIRNCIYGGSLNEMLISVNETNKDWRKLLSKDADKRMRDVETILRFYASYFKSDVYEKSVTAFLNRFMEENKDIAEDKIQEWQNLFNTSLSLVIKHIGITDFPRTGNSKVFNRAVFESVMVAVSRLNKEGKLDTNTLKKKYKTLLRDNVYMEAVTSQTSDKKKYLERLSIAYSTLA